MLYIYVSVYPGFSITIYIPSILIFLLKRGRESSFFHSSSEATYSNALSNDDGHDDSVNSHCLTEDDADQVLGLDTRSLHTRS